MHEPTSQYGEPHLSLTVDGVTEERQGHLPLLQMSGIRKQFGAELVLDDVDFECQAGEIHALLGENGAGKSTLLKALTGEVRIDGGTISIDGREVVVAGPRESTSLGITMVHQELALLGNLTVEENLSLGDEPTRFPGVLNRRVMRIRCEELLQKLDLQLPTNERLGQFELSDRQAVELCKALAMNARILVLDEPTAALAERECERLLAALRTLRKQGLAIVYVSHRLGEVIDLSDRVTVLRNGRRVLTGATSTLDEQSIIRAMIGREVGDLFPGRRIGLATGDPIVRFDAVGFGERIHDVSLELRPGEVVGITGLRGGGQNELGRLISDDIKPTSGRINRSIGERRPRIALVPANRKEEGLALDRPVRENLTASVLNQIRSRMRLLSAKLERHRAASIASEVSIVSPLELETRWLSGGNQQKTLLGRAIADQPDVLVLEEPTRGVDVGARSDIYKVIRRVADQGSVVVVVSTDLLEVSGLSDRVLVMQRGRVSAELDGSETNEELIHAHAQIRTQVPQVSGSEDATGAGAEIPRTAPMRRWLSNRDAAIPLYVLVALLIVSILSSELFLTQQNLQGLAQRTILFTLVGAGQLLVILTRGVDLSVGAAVGLANLVTVDVLINIGAPFAVALLAGVGLGIVIGIVNALFVGFGMPAFLMTFAMSEILRGIIITRYPQSIGPIPESVTRLDDGTLFGIPHLFLVAIALLVVLALFLRFTTAGLHIYAIGGDPENAHLRGLNVSLVRIFAYGLAGALFGLAGVYLTIRVGAGLPNAGIGLEYDSIVVALIGGASLAGGRGTVAGTMIGIGIISTLSNILNLANVDAFFQTVIKGLLLVLVGAAWVFITRRREHQRIRRLGFQAS